ncbi:MAG: SPOR domain-containing protein [Pseudomonadales bacterium]
MDEALKKRLIGAIVLLAIAAILWPLVFDSPDKIKLSRESKIPPKPDVERWQPAEVPEPDASTIGWPDDEIADTATPKVAAPKPPTKDPQGKVAGTDNTDADEKNKAATTPSNQSAPANAEQKALFRPAWVVQVASLSDRKSARQLVEKLRAKEYRAYSEVAERSGKKSFRVLIGPKFDKRKAVSIKQEIDKSEKVDSLVLNFRPK